MFLSYRSVEFFSVVSFGYRGFSTGVRCEFLLVFSEWSEDRELEIDS